MSVLSLDGLLFAVGAIFSWGTALVFLKVRRVKEAKIHPLKMTMFYSTGYLCTGIVAGTIVKLLGQPVNITLLGVLGGAIWGIGKLLTILAVTSKIGLAMGQSIQCCCNIATGFVAAIFTGEQVWWLQFVGIFLLAVGLAIVAAPGMPCTLSLFLQRTGPEGNEVTRVSTTEETLVMDKTMGTSTAVGILQAVGSGVFMGLQSLPYKLCSDHDPMSYALGQALGQFAVILAISFVADMTGCVKGFCADWAIGIRAGLLGGGLLFIAAMCNICAVAQIGLIGSSIGQLNMIVSGVWGIALFHEITKCRLIGLFFFGSVIGVLGAFLLEWPRT